EWKGGIVDRLTSGVQTLLKGNKVDMVQGEVYFVDDHTAKVMDDKQSQTYKFKDCIIATGSTPIEIPSFPFSDRVLDSTGALALEEIPESLVVIGGGYIGTELGSAYANFGTKVTIVEGEKEILSTFDRSMTAVVKKRLKKKDVELVTSAMAKGVKETKDGVEVTYEANGEETTVKADYVLVTVGRRPNTSELGLEQAGVEGDERGLVKVDKQCRTTKENIYAIGDIVPGLPLAHKASYEGKVAAEAISGKKTEVDYLVMPAVVFTNTEMASVGYTAKEAKAEGIKAKASKFPYAANGRALSMNDTDGALTLVTREEDGLVIGAQIVGANASDLISELALAIEAG